MDYIGIMQHAICSQRSAIGASPAAAFALLHALLSLRLLRASA